MSTDIECPVSKQIGETDDPKNILCEHNCELLVSGYCRIELCAQIGLEFVPRDVSRLIFQWLHSNFLQIAATGQLFLKYTGKRRRKPQNRIVKVSFDNEYRPKRISWGSGSRHIDFTNILYIAWGHWTPVFEARTDQLEKELCFSVVGKQQSLNVQAQSKEMAELWVKGLRALLGQSDVESDRRAKAALENREGKSIQIAQQIGDTMDPNDILCGLLVSGYCRTELDAHIGLDFVPEDVSRLIFQWLRSITIPVICQCSDGRYFLIMTDYPDGHPNWTISEFIQSVGNVLRNDLGFEECNLHSNELGQIHVYRKGSETRNKSEIKPSKMEERQRMIRTQFDPNSYLNDEQMLLKQLKEFKEIAEKGQLFTKYTEWKGSKPRECILKVSFDGQDRPKQISWIGGSKSIDFADILCIAWGDHWTPAFEDRKKGLKKELCFSVIGRERSLDIEAQSKEMAELWVRGLRRLLAQHGQVSNRWNLCERKANMRTGSHRRYRPFDRLRLLQWDLFVMTTAAVFQNLEEEGIWNIDQSVKQRFNDNSMWEEALREDIPWRQWRDWIRDQIVSYLTDNNGLKVQDQEPNPPLPQLPYQPLDVPPQVPMNANLIASSLNDQLQDDDGAYNPNDKEEVECKTQ